MTALNLTPARLRLLADVQHHRVYQHPDGASLNAGASGRQVTTHIAHLEGAGWVRLGEGDDYDVRYWELTDAGRSVLNTEAEPTWEDVWAAIGREVWKLAPQDFQDAGHRDLVFGTCWQNVMEAVQRGIEAVAVLPDEGGEPR